MITSSSHQPPALFNTCHARPAPTLGGTRTTAERAAVVQARATLTCAVNLTMGLLARIRSRTSAQKAHALRSVHVFALLMSSWVAKQKARAADTTSDTCGRRRHVFKSQQRRLRPRIATETSSVQTGKRWSCSETKAQEVGGRLQSKGIRSQMSRTANRYFPCLD